MIQSLRRASKGVLRCGITVHLHRRGSSSVHVHLLCSLSRYPGSSPPSCVICCRSCTSSCIILRSSSSVQLSSYWDPSLITCSLFFQNFCYVNMSISNANFSYSGVWWNYIMDFIYPPPTMYIIVDVENLEKVWNADVGNIKKCVFSKGWIKCELISYYCVDLFILKYIFWDLILTHVVLIYSFWILLKKKLKRQVDFSSVLALVFFWLICCVNVEILEKVWNTDFARKMVPYSSLSNQLSTYCFPSVQDIVSYYYNIFYSFWILLKKLKRQVDFNYVLALVFFFDSYALSTSLHDCSVVYIICWSIFFFFR